MDLGSQFYESFPESPKPKKEDSTAEKSGEDVQDESTEKSGQKVEEMSEFHKLLVMRMLRPDRLHYALSDYLDKHMPAEATQPVAYDQVKAYVSTHNLATMILLPTANTYTHSTAKIDLDFVTLLSEAAKVSRMRFCNSVIVCASTSEIFKSFILPA